MINTTSVEDMLDYVRIDLAEASGTRSMVECDQERLLGLLAVLVDTRKAPRIEWCAKLCMSTRDAAVDECAKICEFWCDQWHKDYKVGNGPHRASAHREGMSDAADLLGQAMRELMSAKA